MDRLAIGASTAAIPSHDGVCIGGDVKPSGTGAERSAEPVSPATEPHPARADGLWEVLLSADNLARALRRVEVNRGAPGPDGMSTAELRPYLKAPGRNFAHLSTQAHTDPAQPDG